MLEKRDIHLFAGRAVACGCHTRAPKPISVSCVCRGAEVRRSLALFVLKKLGKSFFHLLNWSVYRDFLPAETFPPSTGMPETNAPPQPQETRKECYYFLSSSAESDRLREFWKVEMGRGRGRESEGARREREREKEREREREKEGERERLREREGERERGGVERKGWRERWIGKNKFATFIDV